MNIKLLAAVVIVAVLGLTSSPQARAAGSEIVLGDVDDLSGLYADIQGAGAVEA